MGIGFYQFARTAVTKYRKLGLKHWHLRPHSAESWQSEIKAGTGHAPSETWRGNPSRPLPSFQGVLMVFGSPWLAAA